MLAKVIVSVALVASVVWALPTTQDVPKFPDSYTATGYILLPYAELKEPFTAFYDNKAKKSRIDYYDGVQKTFQIASKLDIAPHGANFKVVWSPNKDTHKPEMTCFQANATTDGGIDTQNVIPDLKDFKFVRSESCEADTGHLLNQIYGDAKCDRYEYSNTVGDKKNTYTFWAYKIEDVVAPVRYVMMGYDSLLGSHYDKYEVIYTTYAPGTPNSDVFDIKKAAPQGCVPFPDGSGNHLMNPMKEFIHHDESHTDAHFEAFKETHGKQYGHMGEHEQRKNNFRQNLRYVDSVNRQNRTYALKVNHMADWHSHEFKTIKGKGYTPGYNGGKPFPSQLYFGRGLPEHIDWRLDGAVTPVKDQAICGSCWSFGTVGHLEGAYFRKYGKLIKFAEQELIDCSWNSGNGACDGGEDFRAYDYIGKYGLASDEQYGPYLGIDAKCHDVDIKDKPITGLKGFVNVTGVEDLKKAIAMIGPISVGIDAAHKSLTFYSHGVYSDPECRNDPAGLDHAVLAVGYGTLHGEPYWLVKNSWSTYWGNDGYVLFSQKDNMCGVATAATYVELLD